MTFRPARTYAFDREAFYEALSDERERFDEVKRFTLTAEHVSLLRRAYVGWQHTETGAPEIDPKRPYGNSYVAGDVIEILGWPEPPLVDDEREGPEWEAIEDRALTLHRETAVALQIVLSLGSFEPGEYERTEQFNRRAWRRV